MARERVQGGAVSASEQAMAVEPDISIARLVETLREKGVEVIGYEEYRPVKRTRITFNGGDSEGPVVADQL